MFLCCTRCAYFVMIDCVLLSKKDILRVYCLSSIFKPIDKACRTMPAIGIVNDRLEETVWIKILMKTATLIVE